MNNKELKPCPFCSGEAKYGTNDGFHYIWCDDCGETIFGFSKKEAFDIWNKRVQCVDNEENCYYKNEENVVSNGNYLEKQDSSKVNQSVQVPEVVENGSCKYLKLLDYIKFCRNASANDIRQIHDRARDLIAEHKECCKKSCKEENATCKKNLQLTRSDIEKMVEPVEDLPLFEDYENRTCLMKSGCFSLNEVKGVFKNELVDLICSALRIEE